MVHAVATAAVASISSTTFAAPATAVSYAKQVEFTIPLLHSQITAIAVPRTERRPRRVRAL